MLEVQESLKPIHLRCVEDESTSTTVLPEKVRQVSSKKDARLKTSDKPRIMVVEVSGKSQDSLRQFFSTQGFRVLVTENPKRALTRFESVPVPADLLLLSSQVLGQSAVSVFNALASDPYLKKIPALLITSPRQSEIVAEAVEDELRQVITMPFEANDLLQKVKHLTNVKV